VNGRPALPAGAARAGRRRRSDPGIDSRAGDLGMADQPRSVLLCLLTAFLALGGANAAGAGSTGLPDAAEPGGRGIPLLPVSILAFLSGVPDPGLPTPGASLSASGPGSPFPDGDRILRRLPPRPASSRFLCVFAEEPPGTPVDREEDEEFPGVEPQFLRRGLRDPWIAGLASLVLPGSGQFYDSAANHAFALQGYQMGMILQGGAHALLAIVSVFHQCRGLEVEYPGSGGPHVLTERDGQNWRVVHAVNALLASATAFLEALWINAAGRDYVARMRMQAFHDPEEGSSGILVSVAF
jgi:hypothetical protein